MLPIARQVGIAEVADPQRTYRDFALAIESIHPTLATMAQLNLDILEQAKFEAEHDKLIVQFRQQLKMHDNKANLPHATFTAVEGENNDKDKGKQKEGGPSFCGGKPRCLCGMYHYYMDCFYIRTDHPDITPAWKPIPAKVKCIREEIENNPDLKEKIDKGFKRLKQQGEASKTNDKDKDDKKPGGKVVMTVFYGIFSATDSYLRTSWILDGGSATNICNDTMRHRFTKERDCTDGSYIVAGEGPMPILAYGTVDIEINTPNGKGTLTVTNVNYVPNFMTNVVSTNHLRVKGSVWQDPRRCRMERNGETIFTYTENGAHCLIEDNTDGGGDVAPASFAATRSGTPRDWHQLLAYAADDAIQHLPQATEGVELLSHDKVPATNKCETCALSKAHQIISRSSSNSEHSDKPFYRVTYDLIPITAGLNKDQYVSHLACMNTDFQITETHRKKSDVLKYLTRTLKLIKIRYNATVVFPRMKRRK